MSRADEHRVEAGGGLDEPCARRRREITEAIRSAGGPNSHPVAYSAEEDLLWGTMVSKLNAVHPRVASTRYLQAKERLPLPVTHTPRIDDLGQRLDSLTGFRLLPVDGLAPVKEFYGRFGDGIFSTTMYLRCPSRPHYSPEPDMLHELVGHAVMLADPLFADLYRLFGKAANNAGSEQDLQAISQVFWFTMETGLVQEDGRAKAYGAALLSSSGELAKLDTCPVEKFSIQEMITSDYDISTYQGRLFIAQSVEEMVREVRSFLARV
ncbi:phenylalanine 4-monooxygenase [Streptomyces sp. NEAU-W12]|uniref:phenylalanine 4-monooxygenase n=1 Tax=Streptomyces sp. NEAU-W12 TaxID=2994668 RepID=UPI00224AF4FF|nr:phenylalanine 4-monooxygenase [Streptomyces sp. NEAU-W12]MCX2928072.1 phenylalanine 4-monooxygenase [Streptomyces sp. NEAU-W12]